MQHVDHEQLDFLTAAMPPEVWTLPAELARIGVAQGHAVGRLIDGAKEQIAVLDQASAHWVAQVEEALQDLQTVIRQSRAATVGERIPDRMVSVADPDARPIKKGKLGKHVQFGYKVQIMEAENGFVTDYSVSTGNPPDACGRARTRLGSPSRPVWARSRHRGHPTLSHITVLKWLASQSRTRSQ